jgi:hypothetical protein
MKHQMFKYCKCGCEQDARVRSNLKSRVQPPPLSALTTTTPIITRWSKKRYKSIQKKTGRTVGREAWLALMVWCHRWSPKMDAKQKMRFGVTKLTKIQRRIRLVQSVLFIEVLMQEHLFLHGYTDIRV